MLHAPTNDRKTKSEASSKTVEHLFDQEQPSNWLRSRSRQSQPIQQRENLAEMQNAYGNQAMLRMRRSPSINPTQGGVLQRKCACGNASGTTGTCTECQEKQGRSLQTKLTIGEAGDRYEQEADRVAEQVMSMSDRSQRQTIQEKTSLKKEDIQVKTLRDKAYRSSNSLENRLSNSRGEGSSLPEEVRSFMEPRFGFDFSQVRVHTNSESVQMNQELNAQAFTYGNDIYFGADKFPANSDLTAHELTHVVQQTGLIQAKELLDDEEEVTTVEDVGSESIDSTLVQSDAAVPLTTGPSCSRHGQALPLVSTPFVGERGFGHVPTDGYPGPGGLLVTQGSVVITISANWEEQIPDPAQRPPEQRHRRANSPMYYLSFSGWADDCDVLRAGSPASSVRSGNLAIGTEHTVTLQNLLPGRYGLQINPSTAAPEPNRILRGNCEVT